MGRECETNLPYLEQFDPWGKPVSNVVTCQAWINMKNVSAEEGLIAIGYERKYGEFSRIYQFAKLFLFTPSSGTYSCPLAMADGAAKTLESLPQAKATEFQDVLMHLTSRDPMKFWTSGQWMTERRGGSDVANGTETKAIRQNDGNYRLFGHKWFSSATDADVSLTLARIEDANGKTTEGTEGLSMFLLKTRKNDGSLNNIKVLRLKDKLGTRGLPTGELLLDGVEAKLVSEPGRGVSAISNMLTITRIYNTLGSVVAMRRIILLARDYSKKRICFGREISKFPLHMDTLCAMELQARGGTVLVFELVRLLGRTECQKPVNDEEKQLLRLLTPVAKLYTAKKCMQVVSEGLECFGGQGYIEDTGLPAILRNAQVTPIWEGTTNILSMDMLRAVATSKGAVLIAFQENMTSRLDKMNGEFSHSVKILRSELDELLETFQNPNIQETIARARLLAFSVAEITIGTLLLEHASSPGRSKTDVETSARWIAQMPRIKNQLIIQSVCTGVESSDIVFDGYEGLVQSKL
jgi:alkylation response protein AidB-like acyl-CoA dehydrogenase